MDYKLEYARDLRGGQSFQLKEDTPVFVVERIRAGRKKCQTCSHFTIDVLEILVPGGLLTVEPDAIVRVLKRRGSLKNVSY